MHVHKFAALEGMLKEVIMAYVLGFCCRNCLDSEFVDEIINLIISCICKLHVPLFETPLVLVWSLQSLNLFNLFASA